MGSTGSGLRACCTASRVGALDAGRHMPRACGSLVAELPCGRVATSLRLRARQGSGSGGCAGGWSSPGQDMITVIAKAHRGSQTAPATGYPASDACGGGSRSRPPSITFEAAGSVASGRRRPRRSMKAKHQAVRRMSACCACRFQAVGPLLVAFGSALDLQRNHAERREKVSGCPGSWGRCSAWFRGRHGYSTSGPVPASRRRRGLPVAQEAPRLGPDGADEAGRATCGGR